MNIPALKNNARQRVGETRPLARKLVLISAGVSVAASLLVALVSSLVRGYEGQSGLSGMGMAGVLQTVDQVLELAVSLASPFWTMGLVAGLFALAYGLQASPSTLTQGFRRFPVYLRLMAAQVVIILVLCFLLMTPAYTVYFLTPWGREFQAVVVQNPNLASDPMAAMAYLDLLLPMLIIFLILFLPVYLYVSYRIRLAEYYIVAGWNSAVMALVTSVRKTGGRVWDQIKLDVSFWWYYLGQLLLTGLLYLDAIAGLAGWELPVSAQAAYWLCFLAYGVGYVALEVLARPYVEYARIYFFRSVAYTQ